MAIRIVRVSTLDPDQAELALAWNEVFVASAVAAMGDDHDTWSMASRQARESTPNWDRRYLAAVDGGGNGDGVPDGPSEGGHRDRVVASAELTLPLRDNPGLALIDVVVHPDHRRRGIGSVVLDHVVQAARAAGRTTLVTETAYPMDGTDPGEAFLREHGFDLAQTMHRNDLDIARYVPENVTGTGEYAIETSTQGALDEWLEDRAHLQRRMSTDAPVGDLDLGEEVWDAERVRGDRETSKRSGRCVIESVARQVETGQLVAFTQLQVPTADPELAYQQDTLVLREHRGHGLGAALKVANMAALRTQFPQTRTVRTWNAVENGPMIAVNEALGYRTTAIQREWQKRLA